MIIHCPFCGEKFHDYQEGDLVDIPSEGLKLVKIEEIGLDTDENGTDFLWYNIEDMTHKSFTADELRKPSEKRIRVHLVVGAIEALNTLKKQLEKLL